MFNLWFYGFTFLCALAAWALARLGRRRALRRLTAWWARRVLNAVRRILRGRVEARGLERLPRDGPLLLVAKHQSELDAILLLSLFPDMGAVAMQELERYPFVGAIVRGMGLVTVSVERGPQGRTAEVVAGARAVMAEGRPMLIYPEGRLMSLGARDRYRAGAWRIYAETGARAVPVAQSLGAIWPRRERVKRVGRTGAVEFLDPMKPGLTQEAFMAELERRIEAASMVLIREHADGPDLAAAEDRHARRAGNDD